MTCGGFFFAFDPNIGLWNDKINPTWRILFTDKRSGEKRRIPYSFLIQHRGPHAELALRLQFGFVMSDDTFSSIPQSLDVESSAEVTFPLPGTGVRLGHTILRAVDGPSGESTRRATVYVMDVPLGISLGAQRALHGTGTKGAEQLTWQNEVAMVAFVLAVLYGIYSLVTLPRTWMDFWEELQTLDDQEAMLFDLMDADGDGVISRDDLRQFLQENGEMLLGANMVSPSEADIDNLFSLLNPSGSGTVTFEEFLDFMDKVEGLQQELDQAQQHHGGQSPGAGAMLSNPTVPGLFPGGFIPPVGPTQAAGGQLPGWNNQQGFGKWS